MVNEKAQGYYELGRAFERARARGDSTEVHVPTGSLNDFARGRLSEGRIKQVCNPQTYEARRYGLYFLLEKTETECQATANARLLRHPPNLETHEYSVGKEIERGYSRRWFTDQIAKHPGSLFLFPRDILLVA